MKGVDLLIAVIVLTVPTALLGKTIFVDGNASGVNDGTSWVNAYNYLQDALADADSSEKPVEVHVAQGIYRPDRDSANPNGTGNREATFRLIDGVTLKGGYAGYGQADPNARDMKVYETILSGDLAGNDRANFSRYDENSYHVTTALVVEAKSAIEGFTITGGNATGEHPNSGGGGMANKFGSTDITDCTFIANKGIDGGAMDCYDSYSVIKNCTFKDNDSSKGGAMLVVNCRLTLANCTFTGNTSKSGGALNIEYTRYLEILNCAFRRNSADISGGAIWAKDSIPFIANCVFVKNTSRSEGSVIVNRGSETTMINCTMLDNHPSRVVISNTWAPTLHLYNCILWGDPIYRDEWPISIYSDDIETFISHCNIPDINDAPDRITWGPGNISSEPVFMDADGPDDVSGTEDDDLRLHRDSPCIDAGDNSAIPESISTDYSGGARIVGDAVDMGAYETDELLPLLAHYVDSVNGSDENDGRSIETAFATIQKGIDTLIDGDVLNVLPGVYSGEVCFKGKAIRVQGLGGAPILEDPGDFAVSFHYGEGEESILQNFIIRNSFMGIFVSASQPTIRNVTVVENTYAIEAYGGAEPNISNSIFWDNGDSSLFGCKAQYCCSEDQVDGLYNIYANPCFADANDGDYHLKSKRGRFWPEHDVWILDKVTSPCVDTGNPLDAPFEEPTPNGGRINMGAYGGTKYASMSEIDPDINHDGMVNMLDYAILAGSWLTGAPLPLGI